MVHHFRHVDLHSGILSDRLLAIYRLLVSKQLIFSVCCACDQHHCRYIYLLCGAYLIIGIGSAAGVVPAYSDLLKLVG